MVNKKAKFIEKAKKTHGDKYDYSLVDYIGSRVKVIIICDEHDEFEQEPANHLRGQGCSSCKGVKKSNKIDFIKKSKEIHGDKYDYSNVKYKNNKTKVKIICPIHDDFKQTPNNHLNDHGCPECANNVLYTNGCFIEKAKGIHGDKYDYSEVDYINAHIKVKIICPIHDDFKQMPHKHLHGDGCPSCNESKGEIEIQNILKNKNIIFNREQKFDLCKDVSHLRFGFYLPEHNICIEFDGRQHFEIVKNWGGEDGLKDRIRKDKIKTDYCKDNNIGLLRIRYDEDVVEKLDNYLNN